MNSTKRKQ